ncbi:MAG: NAD(P)/FAD-dependent oxidoreductase [Rhodobacteraceae bacterium]|nr:NAD(P)/FAD-dependent oxidoreductase [Paracoccaceae bacterium]
MTSKMLIIGNGPATAEAIEAIRKFDDDSTITVLNKEPWPAYSPCPLALYGWNESPQYQEARKDWAEKHPDERVPQMLGVPREGLFWKGGMEFYTRHKVDLRLSTPAKSIDTERKVVVAENGEEFEWDKLLIAAGATTFWVPIPGLADARDAGLAHAFKTIGDADEVVAQLRDPDRASKKALVMGSGPIGIEASETLRGWGLDVTMVELVDNVLPVMTDDDSSAILKKHMETHGGMRVITGQGAKEVVFNDDGSLKGVVVGDLGLIECDLIINSAGQRPNTWLCDGTDIEVAERGGILVDRNMRTSNPDVFAAGDLSQFFDVVGLQRMIPLWPNAVVGGRIAGFNMTGKPVVNKGGIDANAVNVFELPIAAGGSPKAEHDETLIGRNANVWVKMYLLKNIVVGFTAIGTVREEEMNLDAYNLPEDQLEEIKNAFARSRDREGAGLEGNGIFYTLLRRKQELTEEMKDLIRLGDFRTGSFRALFAIDQHDFVRLPERIGVRGQEVYPR